MGFKKDKAKGRLDKYYKLAKESGYRARAAFKLIQLNKKYHVLEKSKVLLDLCAAPGSWCQVAAATMPANSLIVGVDLAPIKPVPRCTMIQADITTDKCRATIRQHFKSWKADTVLHDGAPNVGTAWVQDAFSQAELVLQSLKLATEFLTPGGNFITKVFRSKDYNSLVWVFNQLFDRVEATKPPASRNVSAEIFVVCRGFKAPKRIDPRFLDPKAVFAELADPTPNNEAKVFDPEKKKRKRQGYEEGDYIQFKEAPVSEFIQTTDPIAMLGGLNKLSFEHKPNGDLALAALDRLPETTQEIRDCCADLKVLGRKDFKLLLRWRLKIREKFGFSSKPDAKPLQESEEFAEVESMDEEMKIQEDMQRIKDQVDNKKKKERRRDNERKQKDLVRMQMNMTTPTDIGLSQDGPSGEDAIFDLRQVEKSGNAKNFARGRMHHVAPKPEPEQEKSEEVIDSDSDGDNLEDELDTLYEQYQERRAEKDAKYRAKRARQGHEDEEFHGFSDAEENKSEDELIADQQSDSSDSEDDENTAPLIRDANANASKGLSNRAKTFFDQDIFQSISGLAVDRNDSDGDSESASDDNIEGFDGNGETEDAGDSTEPVITQIVSSKPTNTKQNNVEYARDAPDSDSDVEEHIERNRLFKQRTEDVDSDDDWSEHPSKEPSQSKSSERPNIDIITAEAMTLAHQLATNQRTPAQLADDNFNKYTLRDTDGLPDWFLDEETQHSKPQRPITKEAVDAIKEKLRAMNARPIKKVREAQARKKFKAAQKLEKLKKKSALLADDEDLTEAERHREMQRLMARAAKKKPKQQVKLVVARGGNRGIKGRPGGTKGKYKMVDPRLKKDMRGMKRAAAKKKR